MLIYLTSQNKPSFSSHTYKAMSQESLGAFFLLHSSVKTSGEGERQSAYYVTDHMNSYNNTGLLLSILACNLNILIKDFKVTLRKLVALW